MRSSEVVATSGATTPHCVVRWSAARTLAVRGTPRRTIGIAGQIDVRKCGPSTRSMPARSCRCCPRRLRLRQGGNESSSVSRRLGRGDVVGAVEDHERRRPRTPAQATHFRQAAATAGNLQSRIRSTAPASRGVGRWCPAVRHAAFLMPTDAPGGNYPADLRRIQRVAS